MVKMGPPKDSGMDKQKAKEERRSGGKIKLPKKPPIGPKDILSAAWKTDFTKQAEAQN